MNDTNDIGPSNDNRVATEGYDGERLDTQAEVTGLIFRLKGELPNVSPRKMRDAVGGSEVYAPTHPLHLVEVNGPRRFAASLVEFDNTTFTVKTYESTSVGRMPLF
jgi:hypothetical protein